MKTRAVLLSVSMLLSLSALAVDEIQELPTCTKADRVEYMERLQLYLREYWDVPREDLDVACTAVIVVNFRGEVLNAGAEKCGGNAELEKSVEDAAYLASPLPLHEKRACHERTLRVRLVHRAPTE